LLRKLSLGTLKEGISSVKVIVPIEVANYLLNKKRKEIFDMEARQNLSVEIKGDNTMVPGESNIIYE
jgi:ribonuclease E